jgi:hypothetical protein
MQEGHVSVALSAAKDARSRIQQHLHVVAHTRPMHNLKMCTHNCTLTAAHTIVHTLCLAMTLSLPYMASHKPCPCIKKHRALEVR